MEEKKGNEKYNEPAQWESPPQGQQDLQESQSLSRNASLNLRETHQEQAEGLRHQSNNAELMEMLKSMKHEVKERMIS